MRMYICICAHSLSRFLHRSSQRRSQRTACCDTSASPLFLCVWRTQSAHSPSFWYSLCVCVYVYIYMYIYVYTVLTLERIPSFFWCGVLNQIILRVSGILYICMCIYIYIYIRYMYIYIYIYGTDCKSPRSLCVW